METLLAILFLILYPFGFYLLLRPDSRHSWEYRNPYTRTCTCCSRQEDWVCWAEHAHRMKPYDHGWWEEMRPGDGVKKCRGK